MSDPIVGIDLGTSNSVVAHADDSGAVTVLADDAGYKLHPSVVSFHPNGGVIVGAGAKQRKVIDPQNTIYSIKRLIGRAFSSPEVQTARQRSPFQIREGQGNSPMIVTRGGEFAVPEISAIVLDHVRNVASARLATPIQRAVVTVPASFNDAQRSATATAGAIAGLTVVRVLNEPTAAALAYGHSRQLREIIAVYDFGGGTFDITLLRLEDQVYEVLGTSGDTFLGGDDLDERLVDKMVAKFLAENHIDLRTNEVSMMRLRAVAEQTKIELSRRSRAVVRVDEIAYGARGAPLNLQIEIARDEFMRDVADLIDRTFPVCAEALALAQLSVHQISDVVLVGGTSKIPYVREQVARFFGKPPRTDVNPEDAVAAGAALQAMSLERILARQSHKVSVPPPPPDEETTGGFSDGVTDVLELDHEPASGAVMAPSELSLAARGRPNRASEGYAEDGRTSIRQSAEPKPDTSYSMTRAGVRDAVADPERYPSAPSAAPAPPKPPVLPPAGASFETRTPSTSQPLGRITRQQPTVGPTTGVHNRTLSGVPAIPAAFEVDLDGEAFPGEPLLRPPAPPSNTMAAVSPPLPGATPPPLPTAPRPSAQQTAQIGATSPPPIPSGPRTTGRQPAQSGRPIGPQQTAQMPTINKPPERRTGQTTGAMAAPPTMNVVLDGLAPLDGEADWVHTDTAAALETWRGAPTDSQPLAPPLPAVPSAPPHAPTLHAFSTDAQKTIVAAPVSYPQSYGVQPLPIHPGPPQVSPSRPIPPILAAVAPAPPRPAPMLLEVTPRGLGIATVAGFCEELIRRNARVPAEAVRLFTTSRDQQDMVRIVVCQGESRRLDNNTVIGDLVLQNLPRQPRGETSIEVTFSLDASGVLHVRARDARTGAEQRASLALVGNVAPEDIAASRMRLQQLRR